MKEKTIMSYQAKGVRLQLIVKNDKIYLIKNRKKVNIDYPYRQTWSTGDKIYHAFLDEISHYFLNEIIYRIHEDGTFAIFKNDDIFNNRGTRANTYAR